MMSEEVTIIRPARAPFWRDARELFRYRELGYFLMWRDLKVRYRHTVLGALWAIIQPLVQMLIFTLVLGRVIRTPSPQIPYAVFVYTALVPWTFWANTLNACNYAVMNNAGLIRKVYFPRLLIPLSALATGLIDLMCAGLVLAGLLWYFKIALTLRALLVVPLILILMLTALGLGAGLAALAVRFRDFRFIIPFIVQIWLFITPVIYPAQLLKSAWRPAYYLNPVAPLMDNIRAVLLNLPGDWRGLYAAVGWMVLILFAGIFYYNNQARRFADRL